MSQLSSVQKAQYFKHRVIKNLRYDVPASIVVFLVALPLCLGIALASDAPLFAGIITGVIAGIIVSLLSGSELSVSGPAAGLTVIVSLGIHNLGGYENFLLAVVLSGVFQILFGLFRSGAVASLFPSSVIKGMLAAIGITIIMKQVPHAFGGFDEFASEMEFVHWNGIEGIATYLQSLFASVRWSAFLIAAGSLALLVLWDTKKVKAHPILSSIPGPLVAVSMGAIANQIFHFSFPSLALHAHDGHLVGLPNLDSFGSLLKELRYPNFGIIGNQDVWIVAFTLAAVGSIETLLCLESTEKLDPLRRTSHRNRELVGQGVGNILAGCVGGIPMTSVIVRSSANIYAGAKTRTSAFLHGVILLLSVVALSSILNLIPLASLAAILLAVGYKLAHPKLVKSVYDSGPSQFFPFAITVAAILFTDLLKGVCMGLCIGLIFVLRTSYESAIVVVREKNNVLVRFLKDVTFIHKTKLRKVLLALPDDCHVLIDGTRSRFFDYDILEMLSEFSDNAKLRDIHVEMKDVLDKPTSRPILGRNRNAAVSKVVAR